MGSFGLPDFGDKAYIGHVIFPRQSVAAIRAGDAPQVICFKIEFDFSTNIHANFRRITVADHLDDLSPDIFKALVQVFRQRRNFLKFFDTHSRVHLDYHYSCSWSQLTSISILAFSWSLRGRLRAASDESAHALDNWSPRQARRFLGFTGECRHDRLEGRGVPAADDSACLATL